MERCPIDVVSVAGAKYAFDSDSHNTGHVDIPKIGYVEIQTGSSPHIALDNDLEITNLLSVKGSGTINAAGSFRKTINLTENSTLTWTSGLIQSVNLVLGSSTNHNVTGYISGNVKFEGGDLSNYGSFYWTTGSIGFLNHVAGATSSITNQAGGYFEISSAGAFADTVQRDVGLFENRGQLKVTSSGVRLACDFLNDGGSALVYLGSIQIDYKAEQSSGVIELNGGTIKPIGTGQVLNVYDGSIIGNGTVDGNLTLGHDPNGPGSGVPSSATIDPGWTTITVPYLPVYTIGTLAITQSFQMFSAGNRMWIDGTAAGNFDKVQVTVQAAVYGEVRVNPSEDYKPANGTTKVFLGAGSVVGDFGADKKTLTYTGYWGHADNPDRQHYWKFRKTATTYEIFVDLVPIQPPPSPPPPPPPPPPGPPPP